MLPVISIPSGQEVAMEDELELLCEDTREEDEHHIKADEEGVSSNDEAAAAAAADLYDDDGDISEGEAEMMCTEAEAKADKAEDDNTLPAANSKSICAPNERVLDFYDPSTCQAYVQMLCVAATAMDLLSSGKTMKLRDVYYSNKSSFTSQQQCNNIILGLGRYLGLRRYEMGIVPASKGLVIGHMKFAFKREPTPPLVPSAPPASSARSCIDAEGTEQTDKANTTHGNLQCCLQSAAAGGMLISPQWTSHTAADIDVQVENDVRLLLVVEKEGIFQRLAEDRFYDRVKCIIVTGCGFPDVATRALVNKVKLRAPHLEVVGVADYNPYGAALLLSYKFSSSKSQTSLETGVEGTCPQLRWLGLRTEHTKVMEREIGAEAFSSALQQYTTHDQSKIAALLRNQHILHDKCCRGWYQELLSMQKVQRKVELEALYLLGMGAVSDWVEQCIQSKSFI